MKPFDIQKAKDGAKIVTRDGRPFQLLSTEGRGAYPVIGYVGDDTVPQTFMYNGTYRLYADASVLDPKDLFLADENDPVKVWVCLFHYELGRGYIGNVWKTKEAAENNANQFGGMGKVIEVTV